MTFKHKLVGFVSALALSSAGLTTSAFANAMEIEDIGKIQNAGNLTLSPDGQTVAYTVSKYPDLLQGEADGGSASQLYVMRPGADPVAFTSGAASVSRVQFSPEGDKVHFISRRGDDKTNSLYGISPTKRPIRPN